MINQEEVFLEQPRDKFDDPEDRKGFIRKVYSILGTQLLVTALVTLIPFFSTKVAMWMTSSQSLWLLIALLVLMIVIMCLLICVKKIARTPPYNYIGLFAFTICMAYLVAVCCAAVSNPSIVLAAACITAAMVLAITLYAFTASKGEILTCMAFLFILVMTSLMVAIFTLFVYSYFLYMFFVGLGVVIFGIYLLIDTYFIMHKKHYQLYIDDYVLAAMILYLDIIMIFLYVLRLLGGR